MSNFPSLKGYIFTEKIGKGSYATVYKAYKNDSTEREVVAIKCVEKSTLNKASVENLLTEISILKKVKNEYIVELKDFQWDNKFIYLIMEYCTGGDLSKFIKQRKCLPEITVQKFLQQMACSLKVLRTHNIAHLDLKPHNIFLSSYKSTKLKIGDFGFAQYLDPNERSSSFRGSPLYMAPEILSGKSYDAKVDLWSIGIILYECLFGQAPYSSNTFAELAEKIKTAKPIKLPYNVSPDLQDLLLSLLQRDPKQRISFEDFFQHPFVDLEHMLSPESYSKGVELLKGAVKLDSQNKTSEAIKAYSLGLQYLLPVLYEEQDTAKKTALRSKVNEYMDRAEELKLLLLPSETEVDGPVNPKDDLIKPDQVYLDSASQIKIASRLAAQGYYHESIDIYKKALETVVPYVQRLPKGPLKDELGKQVSKWMKDAEDTKAFLLFQKVNTQDKNTAGTSSIGGFSYCRQQ